MIIGEKILNYREDIVKTLSELVKIPSKNGPPQEGMPFGKGPYDALEYMLELASDMGFKVKNVDGYAGHAEYGEGDEIAAAVVHLDVVPEGEGWTLPPYSGLVQDGRVYGRGAGDNKGPAVVALYCLKMLKDMNVKTNRRFRVIFGTNEESGMRDMDYYTKHEQMPDMAFSPDGGYPIMNGEMGILRAKFSDTLVDASFKYPGITIKGGNAANMVPDRCVARIPVKVVPANLIEAVTKNAHNYNDTQIETSMDNDILLVSASGKSAHGAAPGAGINAVSHLFQFLKSEGLVNDGKGLGAFLADRIGLEYNGGTLGIAMKDDISSPLSLNLGIISTDENSSSAIIDIRYPVSAKFEDIFGRLAAEAGIYDVETTVYNHSKPIYVDKDSRIVKILTETYEGITGKKADLITIAGGSYSRKFDNRCVLFGGAGANVHQPNEYCDLEPLMEHAVICAQAMYDMSVK